MTHTVQVGDGNGNSFNISVDVGYLTGDGAWRALSAGYLKYTSGIARAQADGGVLTTDLTLYLYGTGGPSAGWGIRLDSYADLIRGVNAGGNGMVAQPWVLQFSPGAISWAEAD